MLDSEKNSKIPLFRVQEVTRNIRRFLEDHFSSIGIRGEISSFIRHSSGHWYFTLKDSASQIKGVMFRSSNQKITFKPKIGMEVIVWGKITVYEPRGDYQILSHHIERSGEGDLQRLFEELKEKLKKEGLFERKRPLPFLPQHIAIITSLDGAAIKDVLNVLNRRFQGVKITVSPALMEGQLSSRSVILALRQALKLKNVDVILITRGGGSAESLWPFNDEALAREVFACPIPVVSAIGHEIDFTIVDFVADLRAPTPSVAAELISKNASELLENIKNNTKSLVFSLMKNIQYLKKQVTQCRQILPSPLSKVEDELLKCDDYMDRLMQGFNNICENKKQSVKKWQSLLQQLNPIQVMNRGYSLCFKGNQIIQDVHQLSLGDHIRIRFLKGQAKAKIVKRFSSKFEN